MIFIEHDTPRTGLPRWLSGKEPTCHYKRHRFGPRVRKIPWRREWQEKKEKEMAAFSSILVWEIPWTEEPGELHTVHGVAKEPDTT